MPNVRHKNQTCIAFACDVELLRLADTARKLQGQDRSKFIRIAIRNELKSRGIPLTDDAIQEPDRVRKTRYPDVARSRLSGTENPALNDGRSGIKNPPPPPPPGPVSYKNAKKKKP